VGNDPKVPIELTRQPTERQVVSETGALPEVEHTRAVGTPSWPHVVIFTQRPPTGDAAASGAAPVGRSPAPAGAAPGPWPA